MSTNMLNILRVTLNRAKMVFLIVKEKRYRRIISNDTKFQENILQLRNFFLERNYPESIVDEALGNVSSLTQDDVSEIFCKF